MRKLAAFFIAARLYILVFPSALFYTGAAMNQVVLVANGGKFPVMVNDRHAKIFDLTEDDFMDDIHCRMTGETHLNWLADLLTFGHTIVSLGDLLIDAGRATASSAFVAWATLLINDKVTKQPNEQRGSW